MRLKVEKSLLMVIDVQFRLLNVIDDHQQMYQNILDLIKSSQMLDVPILATAQAPLKLGSCVDAIAMQIAEQHMIAKTSFSCLASGDFRKHFMDAKRPQAIITGLETHVCVMQTVLDMIEHHLDVFVVVDAVLSRKSLDHNIALDRMSKAGATLVTSEMVLTEWIQTADHPHFKTIMSILKS